MKKMADLESRVYKQFRKFNLKLRVTCLVYNFGVVCPVCFFSLSFRGFCLRPPLLSPPHLGPFYPNSEEIYAGWKSSQTLHPRN